MNKWDKIWIKELETSLTDINIWSKWGRSTYEAMAKLRRIKGQRRIALNAHLGTLYIICGPTMFYYMRHFNFNEFQHCFDTVIYLLDNRIGQDVDFYFENTILEGSNKNSYPRTYLGNQELFSKWSI